MPLMEELYIALSDDKTSLGMSRGDDLEIFLRNSSWNTLAFVAAAEDPAILKVGSDLKNAIKVLWSCSVNVVGPFFDIGVAKAMLDPATIEGIKFITDEGEKSEDLEDRLLSACQAIKKAKDQLSPLMDKEGLRKLSEEIEMPLLPVIAEMESGGILIDREAIDHSIHCIRNKRERLKKEIWTGVGKKFEINNPEKLSEVLFNERRYMPLKKLRRYYATDLKTLGELEPEPRSPLLQNIIDFRKTIKPLSELYNYRERMNSKGLIRLSFKHIGAATGRMSCSKPNVQNAQDVIKRCIVASEGNILLSLDYSQIQLRLLAHLSGDKALIDLFSRDEDIHTITAAKIFGKETDAVTKEERRAGKAVNFGVLFGRTPEGLAEELNIPIEEAKEYGSGFFSNFKRATKLKTAIYKQVKGPDRAVVSLMGRKRYFRGDEYRGDKGGLKDRTYRQAFNSAMQMAEVDIVKLAMINVRDALPVLGYGVYLVLQVHDSLVYECPENKSDDTLAFIKDIMESVVKLKVPLKVDAEIGYALAEPS
jgi:DNA polymerase I